MTTCSTHQQSGLTWLAISGRMDSLSSVDIQNQFDELILSGSRLIAVNLEQVSFISSAGLRVFLGAQNQLTKVGGEIILFHASESVRRVFTMTGFDQICKIMANAEELATVCADRAEAAEVTVTIVDGVTFKCRETAATEPGDLCIIGSQDKLASAGYTEQDVVTVNQSSLRFGAGLATIGERYEEYQHLFGEAVSLERNFYFYPAVKRPAVDYMFYSSPAAGTECRFFHGFGFDGAYRYVAAFEAAQGFVTQDRLIEWVLSLPSQAPLLGIVLLAESKGLFGMNLKRIPIAENRAGEAGDVFALNQVASWINFPVDPIDQNHIVAATGLVCRNKASCSVQVRKLFSSESSSHVHAGIFEKGPISKNIDQFSAELHRVLTGLAITKVQHLLGQSRFSNGLIGVIELKG